MKFNIFGITISFDKEQIKEEVKKVHTTGYTSAIWTKEDIIKLIDMYNREKTPTGMARMLSRTKAAVNAKLWKLKKEGKIV